MLLLGSFLQFMNQLAILTRLSFSAASAGDGYISIASIRIWLVRVTNLQMKKNKGGGVFGNALSLNHVLLLAYPNWLSGMVLHFSFNQFLKL